MPKFDPEGSDYDYDTAKQGGLGPTGTGENQGHWGSVTRASKQDRQRHGLPADSYIVLKGKGHETWGKAEEAERARGAAIIKLGDRYFSVPKKWAAEKSMWDEEAAKRSTEDRK
jgi:hypothetical protein